MSTETTLSSQSNLYDVLGIAPNADDDEVRRAFRSLARLLHPDVNASEDAAQRFARVAHAHSILSDRERRRAYDASRQAPRGAHVRSPNVARTTPAAHGVLRGADVEASVSLSIREAAFGTEVTLDVKRREVCAVCLGAGAEDGGTSTRCPTCLGSGGTRTRGDECSRCQGSGVLGSPPCSNCSGSGRKRGHTSLVVAIPAAVEDGQILRLKGDGDAGPRNGPRGDLLLLVSIEPDPVLRRSGIDILMDLPISTEDAESGCSVEVPTLRGPKRVRVPAHSKDRTLLRIGGAGLRPPGSWHKGDQFVTVRIDSTMANEREF
jgi:molecular chaperone DnaJ